MATATQFLDQCRKWLGYHEGYGNRTYFGTREGYPGQPWCGAFIQVCFEDVGMRVTYAGSSTSEPSPISTVNGATRYKALGRWVPRNGVLRPGLIPFFDYAGTQDPRRADHVEALVSWGGGDVLYTIGGNVGDSVRYMTRHRNQVIGFGVPLFSGTASGPSPVVSTQAALLKWLEGRINRAKELLPAVKAMPDMGPFSSSLHVAILQASMNLIDKNRHLVESGQYDGPTTQAVRDFQAFFGVPTHDPNYPDFANKADPYGFAHEYTRFFLILHLEKIIAGKA